MSANWIEDIETMHHKYGVNEKVREFDANKLAEFLQFRIRFLQEELNELQNSQSGDDAVDALIDLCVVAIGTLDAFGVNAERAWNAVHDANMAKAPGVKPERPNPLGLPDLIKPEGWTAPSHVHNHAYLDTLFDG